MRLPEGYADPTPEHVCPGTACHGAFMYWKYVGMICTRKLLDLGVTNEYAAWEISARARIEQMDGLGLA